MSATDERAPLLPIQQHEPLEADRGAWNLARAAEGYLVDIDSGGPARTAQVDGSEDGDIVKLSILLYALYSIRARASRYIGGGESWTNQRQIAVRESELQDGIAKVLDEIGDDEAFTEVLWTAWKENVDTSRYVCAIDLMLPPFASSPSSLLLHPHLQHHLHRVWQEGLLLKDDPLFKLPPRTTWNRWLHTLRRKITPARIHFFHCLSFLALYIIVITICLNPGNYATPHSPFDEHGKRQRGRWTPSPAEGAASIWVLAGFWAAFHRPVAIPRLILLSPLYLAVPISLWHNSYAFDLLTLSIPTLTTLLVLPYYPSLSLLSPSRLLSHSVLLVQCLGAILKPLLLFLPLSAALLVAFSWAVNGDIGRLAVVLRGLQVMAGGEVKAMGRWDERVPTDGVAPEQTRWSLLFSLCLVLGYVILLATARLILLLRPIGNPSHLPTIAHSEHSTSIPPPVSVASASHLANAVRLGLGKPKPSSEGNHSVPPPRDASSANDTTHTLPQSSSRVSYRSIEDGQAGPPPAIIFQSSSFTERLFNPFTICPVPLNQVFDILELAHGAAWIARRAGWTRASEWEHKIDVVADKTAVLIMGPACLLLDLVERGWGKLTRRTSR